MSKSFCFWFVCINKKVKSNFWWIVCQFLRPKGKNETFINHHNWCRYMTPSLFTVEKMNRSSRICTKFLFKCSNCYKIPKKNKNIKWYQVGNSDLPLEFNNNLTITNRQLDGWSAHSNRTIFKNFIRKFIDHWKFCKTFRKPLFVRLQIKLHPHFEIKIMKHILQYLQD